MAFKDFFMSVFKGVYYFVETFDKMPFPYTISYTKIDPKSACGYNWSDEKSGRLFIRDLRLVKNHISFGKSKFQKYDIRNLKIDFIHSIGFPKHSYFLGGYFFSSRHKSVISINQRFQWATYELRRRFACIWNSRVRNWNACFYAWSPKSGNRLNIHR